MTAGQWLDVARGRGLRDRCSAQPPPDRLRMLDADHAALLARWLRSDRATARRATLLQEAGPSGIERAEALCDILLRDGWIVQRERFASGSWQWESITWRDLPRLQSLLGVVSPRQRSEERKSCIAQAVQWLQARRDGEDDSTLDPDLLDELACALDQLGADKTMRLDLLATRLQLLRAVTEWHDSGNEGSRRDFALRALGATKAIGDGDWRWLETHFDLERLRIAPFAPMAWLAGDLRLAWGTRQVEIGHLHVMALSLADLARATAAAGPTRWWLIENRTSFERQALALEAGTVAIWLPGRPTATWLSTMRHLLGLLPQPAWISADADPAGVDIACTAGALWTERGLAWEPHRMGAAQLAAAAQDWPLNDHDRHLLARLMARQELPPALRGLCEAMVHAGRKAEQEGWL